MQCVISKRIAEHCDEIQERECPICFGVMIEVDGTELMQCDSCDNTEWI